MCWLAVLFHFIFSMSIAGTIESMQVLCTLITLLMYFLLHYPGHAIAQAVSCWLPTAVAQVRSQVRSCGICVGQRDAGSSFLRVLGFLLPILIPPGAPHSSSYIIWGCYNRPNSGQCIKWTQSHPTSRN
jgi:hypothetical protein